MNPVNLNTSFHPVKKSLDACGEIHIAIGIITLIGSLAAIGCFHSSLSYSISGIGMIYGSINVLLGKWRIHEHEEQQPVLHPIYTPTNLPPIFDLKLDPTHPLSKPLEFDANDHELLNLSLSDFVRREPEALAIIQDPSRQVARFEERIELLDQVIQLRDRLVKLNYPDNLMLWDLCNSWSNSHIKHVLMMNDEFSRLPAAAIAQLNNHTLWAKIGNRIHAQSQLLPAIHEEEILLIDLPKYTAEQINQAPEYFPPLTFLLIEVSELQKIRTDQLTTAQLELIFSAFDYTLELEERYYVHNLTPKQINACIPLISQRELFKNLSKEQVLKLDFDLMDQGIFDILFPPETANTEELLRELASSKGLKLLPFFGENSWYLSTVQQANRDQL